MNEFVEFCKTIKELYHIITGRDDMSITVDEIIKKTSAGELRELSGRIKDSKESDYGRSFAERLASLEDPDTARAVAAFAANLERALRQPIYDSRKAHAEPTRPPWKVNEISAMVMKIVPEVVRGVLQISHHRDTEDTEPS